MKVHRMEFFLSAEVTGGKQYDRKAREFHRQNQQNGKGCIVQVSFRQGRTEKISIIFVQCDQPYALHESG